MRGIGSFGEGVWVWNPAPDGAESWLGGLVQEPLAATIALLLLAVALVLATHAPAQTLKERAPALPGAATASHTIGGQLPEPSSPTVSKATEHHLQGAYGKLPLSFVENKGQTNKQARYYAQGSDYSFFFTNHKVVLALTKGKREQVLNLRFLGARSNASLERGPPLRGRVNHLRGSDRSKWHTDLRTYHALRYRDLWPGIDMVFRGHRGKLTYVFHVKPGANPSDIRLAYQGAKGLSLSNKGNLQIETPLGVITDERPRSFQRIGVFLP